MKAQPFAAAVSAMKRDRVIGAGLIPILEFGLGHSGAERDIPQRRCLRLVRLTSLHIADECQLRGTKGVVSDRTVGLRPVD